jgi:hypothetical protein
MDAIKLNAQAELDHDILAYVRGMADTAPVTQESVFGFVTVQRHRRVRLDQVKDRMAYLVAADYLEPHREWQAGEGEILHYTITANGMDMLDGVIPPRNWSKR